MWIALLVVVVLFFLCIRWVRNTGPDQPVRGCVLVTGCDSGMGETTALHLAKVGFHVFAACFTEDGVKRLSVVPGVSPLQLDVSKEEQVTAAAATVARLMREKKLGGLYGVLQCAGIAFTAPFEYIPEAAFRRQMEVNFFGYVSVARAFLPLVKEAATPDRRGRIVFVSSGPLPGPGVAFITSYLAAKWAGEAVLQGLGMEMTLRGLPIDCSVLSPGVVKPTRLAEEGNQLLERTFREMPPNATAEYREMVDVFRQFQMDEVGTHVSQVGLQMERIMRHGRPHLRYFVGPDSVASIVVGVLPTKIKYLLIRNTLFRKYAKGPFVTVPLLGVKIYTAP